MHKIYGSSHHKNCYITLLTVKIVVEDIYFEEQKMAVNAIVLMMTKSGAVNDVAQNIVDIDGVKEVFSVAGRYDLVAVLHARSNEHVADIVTEAVQSTNGIKKTETLLAFKAYDKSGLEAAFAIGNDENA